MNHKEIQHVILYTDGACAGNPGPGGYGVILKYGYHRKEISEGFRKTTNNRMELMAVITGLSALKGSCRVTVYTDSRYIVESINQGWARRWKENGWKRSKKEKALNPDLWEHILGFIEKHEVEFKWVRGHAGDAENERADYLATKAIKSENKSVDRYYEERLN